MSIEVTIGMTKIADDAMSSLAKEFLELGAAKKGIDDRIEEVKKSLKQGMEERSSVEAVFDGNKVSIVKVAGSVTVDSEKLKADGLYDKYSKLKAGYTQVKVAPYKASKPKGAF